MYAHQAKKLRAGDKVVWSKDNELCNGEVTRKYYNTICIKWDDQAEPTVHYADLMPHVFTPAQLEQMKKEAEVAAAMPAVLAERRKLLYRWT